jgi:hypothetical protein
LAAALPSNTLPAVGTRHVIYALGLAAVLLDNSAGSRPRQPAAVSNAATLGPITIDAVPVRLNPQSPSTLAVGDFVYAGGVILTSPSTSLLHELSDIVITGPNRFAAVGDGGVLLEASFVLDAAGALVGVADATLTPLVGQDGKPLAAGYADAEGLAVLPSGDRLISFERRHRIWLYPKDGGVPRAVPSPPASFASNAGMEALTAAPDIAADAYRVGVEDSGETWTCRISGACVADVTIAKPKEFGLVSMARLSPGVNAYLLRAYDPVRHNRIMLEIFRGATLLARMDMARPLTVDNFEGLASDVNANGARRFYLISDDNNRSSQRTLLLAFDWLPR